MFGILFFDDFTLLLEMNLLLLFSLLLAYRPLPATAMNTLSNFSILFVQEFSPSRYPAQNVPYLLTFIRRLNQTLDLGSRSAELWLMMGGSAYSSNGLKGMNNILKMGWYYMSDVWNLYRKEYSGNAKNLTDITRYAAMFVAAGRHFDSEKTFGGQKVLILLTHGREQCKVEECLKNDCCKPCHACNTSSCEIQLMIRNKTRTVNLFVSHEAEDLKEKGVTIIPIGVGNRTEPARLKCFASENHYIQLDSYENLPVDGLNQVSRLLGAPGRSDPVSTTITMSSPTNTAPIALVGTATRSTSLLDSTTHRMASNTTMPPWWYTVAIAGGFILVILILVVVIAILLKRRQRAKTATASRHSSHVIHGEPSSGAPRVEERRESDTTGKAIGVLPGPQHGADGTFSKFGSGEKFRTLRLGLKSDVKVQEKYVGASEPPDAGRLSSKTSTHTIQGLYPKYSDGTLAAVVTERSATYDTVKSPNAKSGRSYTTYQAGVTHDYEYEQFQ